MIGVLRIYWSRSAKGMHAFKFSHTVTDSFHFTNKNIGIFLLYIIFSYTVTEKKNDYLTTIIILIN